MDEGRGLQGVAEVKSINFGPPKSRHCLNIFTGYSGSNENRVLSRYVNSTKPHSNGYGAGTIGVGGSAAIGLTSAVGAANETRPIEQEDDGLDFWKTGHIFVTSFSTPITIFQSLSLLFVESASRCCSFLYCFSAVSLFDKNKGATFERSASEGSPIDATTPALRVRLRTGSLS
jgi:hypothetical protein